MAKEEAIATINAVRFINQHLMPLVPGRTEESIKGARRKAGYKAMVVASIVDIQSKSLPVDEDDHVIEEPTSTSDETLQRTDNTDATDTLDPRGIRRRVPQLMQTIRLADGHTHLAIGLLSIAEKALLGQSLEPELSAWFTTTRGQGHVPSKGKEGQTTKTETARTNAGRIPSNRARRRREYARTQALWRTNQNRAEEEIMEGGRKEASHNLEAMEHYWGALLGQESEPYDQIESRDTPTALPQLWDPISCEEVGRCKIPSNSAAGPE